ncbi:type II toxin-antitoxin system HipA family toxin [Flavobacterium sp.]|uniref:type II toxin-antitoxin system HipA family toxin n=1 Tax=Flavobacterium sp. TaxID=239 RepID=UPI00333EA711
MKKTEKLNVFIDLADKVQVGQLIHSNNQIYFKYNTDFLELNINISPLKLDFNNEIQTCNVNYFEGLFGVFSDSLPDGWGKLLQDRHLIKQGINPSEVYALDRLTLLHKNNAGSLSYMPTTDFQENKFIFNLDKLATEIETITKGNSENIIDELLTYGGSSGGARPKVYIGYNKNTDEIIYGSEILPEGFEHWILKFPNSNDLLDIAKIEFTYNQMAKNAGIEVNEFKLFKNSKNQYFFGAKRFDREENKKTHLHSVAGLLHDNFRFSVLDYGHIMDCTYQLEKDFSAYEKILRLATFNVLAHNRDDHSKNFSFLMDDSGKWKFSPAYDLTFSNSSNGMHSTSIANEYQNPGYKNLQELATHFSVNNYDAIFNEVRESISNFDKLANEIELNKNTKKLILTKIS